MALGVVWMRVVFSGFVDVHPCPRFSPVLRTLIDNKTNGSKS
jgi:hypothetical protein